MHAIPQVINGTLQYIVSGLFKCDDSEINKNISIKEHFQEIIHKIKTMYYENSSAKIFNYKRGYDIKEESTMIDLRYVLMIVLDIYSSTS